jgi:hypothetical protein
LSAASPDERFKCDDRDSDHSRVTSRAVPSRDLPEQRVESRFRKGTTTFGPVGRISWTVGVVAVPLFVVTFGSAGGIVFFLIWCTVVAPMALRDIWKKDWVYVPGTRAGVPAPSLTSWDGTRMPSLGEYVAAQAPPPPQD